MRPWFDEHLGADFMKNRDKAMHMLQEENELNEIVQLVGKDSLSAGDQLTLEVARMLREDFLQQTAFMDVDSYSSFDRQKRMLQLILNYDSQCRDAIGKGVEVQKLFDLPVRTAIAQAKYDEADTYQATYDQVEQQLEQEVADEIKKAGEEQ